MHKTRFSRYIAGLASTINKYPSSLEVQVMEIWLRRNPRPYWAALAIPVMLAMAGAVCLWAAKSVDRMWPYGWGACVFFAGAALLAALLFWQAKLPVVVLQGGNLLLFFGSARPIAIPVQIVECFFSGQGDALLKDRAGKELEAATVILRLAEAAKEWHHRDVAPAFAHWCEGYITIRGSWCEPIGPELLRNLNQRLVASQRALKASQT